MASAGRGVAVGYGLIEALGHFDAPGLELLLTLVQTLLVLKWGFKALTGSNSKPIHFFIGRQVRCHAQARQLHAVAGV